MASLQQLANYVWSPKLNLKLLCRSALHLLQQSNNRCFTNWSLMKCNTKSIMRFYCNSNRFYSSSRDLQKSGQFSEFKLWGVKNTQVDTSHKNDTSSRDIRAVGPCPLACSASRSHADRDFNFELKDSGWIFILLKFADASPQTWHCSITLSS